MAQVARSTRFAWIVVVVVMLGSCGGSGGSSSLKPNPISDQRRVAIVTSAQSPLAGVVTTGDGSQVAVLGVKNNIGQLTQISQISVTPPAGSGSSSADIFYDADGKPSQMKFSDGASINLQFPTSGSLLTLTINGKDGTSQQLGYNLSNNTLVKTPVVTPASRAAARPIARSTALVSPKQNNATTSAVPVVMAAAQPTTGSLTAKCAGSSTPITDATFIGSFTPGTFPQGVAKFTVGVPITAVSTPGQYQYQAPWDLFPPSGTTAAATLAANLETYLSTPCAVQEAFGTATNPSYSNALQSLGGSLALAQAVKALSGEPLLLAAGIVLLPEELAAVGIAATTMTIICNAGNVLKAIDKIGGPIVELTDTLSTSGVLTVYGQRPNANAREVAQLQFNPRTEAPPAIVATFPCRTISISPNPVTVDIGTGGIQLQTSLTDPVANAITTSPTPLVFDSQNTSIASVTSAGVVVGFAPGSTTVSVRDPDSGATASVTVMIGKISFYAPGAAFTALYGIGDLSYPFYHGPVGDIVWSGISKITSGTYTIDGHGIVTHLQITGQDDRGNINSVETNQSVSFDDQHRVISRNWNITESGSYRNDSIYYNDTVSYSTDASGSSTVTVTEKSNNGGNGTPTSHTYALSDATNVLPCPSNMCSAGTYTWNGTTWAGPQ